MGTSVRTMKKALSGFSLIELMVAIGLLCILMALAAFGYKRYEARFRCNAAATILAQDLRLQQERARTMDGPQGIYFRTKYKYSLGSGTSILNFASSRNPRNVDLTQQYNGIFIEAIHDNADAVDHPPPYYIFFDPRAADASGTWTPLSGFSGYIIFNGGNVKVNVKIAANKEVTIEAK
jgi:prepilin-type N-terminal cleavage/methylation domain-containing protein